MIKLLQKIGFVLALVMPFSAAPAEEWQYYGVERVVAISDIHGAYEAMLDTLQNAGVIDDGNRWIGDATHLVIVGDILDRGPDSRAAMDLLMQLEQQAASVGGRVHVLIGNHEEMNLSGDLRFVAREEFAAFSDEETAAERARWFGKYTERAAAAGQEISESSFDKRYPRGFFAHRRAFRADGKYGKWLLGKPILVVINGIAYVHGGVSPLLGRKGLEVVNGTMMKDLARYVEQTSKLIDAGVLLPGDNSNHYPELLDQYLDVNNADKELLEAAEDVKDLSGSPLLGSDGPLWYRGNVACSRVIEEQRLVRALEKIGATRVVIGHSPTPGREVLQRFEGRILEIDTGMFAAYYKGVGNALILRGDEATVVSQTGADLQVPREQPRRVGLRPGGMTAAQLEGLLRHGDIVIEGAREGIPHATIVKVSDGTHTVEAMFNKRRSRGFYPNVAAYRLDRQLGLGLVPVSVRRRVDGHEGSLQFLPYKSINERDRAAAGRGGQAWCPIGEQWNSMYLFDALIYNESRSLEHMLYAQDRWQLISIGHQRAFSTRKGMPRHLESAPIEYTAGWREALQRLDSKLVDEQFGDVLDKKRRRALQARRDALLATFEEELAP